MCWDAVYILWLLFVMRVSNYQAMMGTYHRQLWNKILPILQAAPEDVRATALNTHLEATTLATVSYTHLTLPTKA